MNSGLSWLRIVLDFDRVGRGAPVFGIDAGWTCAVHHAVDDASFAPLRALPPWQSVQPSTTYGGFVHRLDAVVAFETAALLASACGLGLVDPVARGQPGAAEGVALLRDGDQRPEAVAVALLGVRMTVGGRTMGAGGNPAAGAPRWGCR